MMMILRKRKNLFKSYRRYAGSTSCKLVRCASFTLLPLCLLTHCRISALWRLTSFTSMWFNVSWFSFNNSFILQRIEQLKRTYESVEDIDLIAGLWAEKLQHDGLVPPTFYCLIKDQMLRTVKSDRHWFERDTRPNAFTGGKHFLFIIRLSDFLYCGVFYDIEVISSFIYKEVNSSTSEHKGNSINTCKIL